MSVLNTTKSVLPPLSVFQSTKSVLPPHSVFQSTKSVYLAPRDYSLISFALTYTAVYSLDYVYSTIPTKDTKYIKEAFLTSSDLQIFTTVLITDEFKGEQEKTTEAAVTLGYPAYTPRGSSVPITGSISHLFVLYQTPKSWVSTVTKVKFNISVTPHSISNSSTTAYPTATLELSSKDRTASVITTDLRIFQQSQDVTLFQYHISTITPEIKTSLGYIITSKKQISKYYTTPLLNYSFLYYTQLQRKSSDAVTKEPTSSTFTEVIFLRYSSHIKDTKTQSPIINTTFIYETRGSIIHTPGITHSTTFHPGIKDHKTFVYEVPYNITYDTVNITAASIDRITYKHIETYSIYVTTVSPHGYKYDIYSLDSSTKTVASVALFKITSTKDILDSSMETKSLVSSLVKSSNYSFDFKIRTASIATLSETHLTTAKLFRDTKLKVTRDDMQSPKQKFLASNIMTSIHGSIIAKHFTSNTPYSSRTENSTIVSGSSFLNYSLAVSLQKISDVKTSLAPQLRTGIGLLEKVNQSSRIFSGIVSKLYSSKPVPSSSTSKFIILGTISGKTVSYVKHSLKPKFEISMSDAHTSIIKGYHSSVRQENTTTDNLYSNTIDLLSTTHKNVTDIPVSFTIDTSSESAVTPTISHQTTTISATSKFYNLTTNGSYIPKLTTPFVKETDKTFSSFIGYVLNGDDEISRPLQLPSSVVFGNDSYNIIYISTNGYVTFGKKQNFPSPQRFPDPPNMAIIAPFWSDLDVKEPGRVTYKFFEIGTKNFHAATKLVKSHDEKSLFKKWILVITWENVQPSSKLENITEMATFQMALVPTKTEKRTFFIFSYLPGMQSWTKTLEHTEVSIGFSDGNNNYKQNEHSFSLSALELYHIKGNTGKPGVWVEKIENNLDTLKQQCIKYGFSADNWTHSLSHTCPCIQTQAKSDFRFKLISTENDISTFESIFEENGVKEQCVYSNNSFGGTLLIGSPLGGTITVSKTETLDKRMKKFCCEGDPSYCNLYYNRRPSPTCDNYLPPKLGWSWGDSHIHTMDGNDYTFNGWGEYEMIYMMEDIFRIQIRIEDSISTGFAMKTLESSIIELTMVECTKDVKIVINKTEKYSMSLMNASLNNPNFLIEKQNQSLLVTFRNGIAVKITPHLEILTGIVSIPSEINGVTYGLLGFGNGNSTDDFLGRNGQMWSTNSSERQLFEFGETWRVRVNESLFTYTKKRTFNSYHNLSFVPKFFDEMNLTLLFSENSALLEAAIQQCSNSSFYEACLQDSAKMQNVQAAIQGAQMHTEALMLQRYFEQIIPRLKQTPKVLSVEIYKNITFKLELDQCISLPVSFQVKTNCKNYQFNEKTGVFSWTPLTSNPCHLKFRSLSGTQYSPEYWPAIYFCNCENGGECDVHTDYRTLNENEDKFYRVPCVCPKNFGGDKCEVRPCILSHCHENVRCKEKSNVPVCGNCPYSMVGTGKVCYGLLDSALCVSVGIGILAILLLICLLICCIRRQKERRRESSSGTQPDSVVSWIPQHQFLNDDSEPRGFRNMKQTLNSDPWEINSNSSDGPAFFAQGIPAFFSSSIRGLNGTKLSDWSPGALQVNLRNDLAV
ncbi:mucin-like protein [Argonauta hians]